VAANPFASPGEWLRFPLHPHTTNSDGELAPTLGEITAARLARPGSTSYRRLELRDAEGGAAWTNPLWS